MTREEKITMLKSKLDGRTDTSYEWCECVRMVIKALEQEPKTDGDCISRQVAIDAIENEQKKIMRSDWAIDQAKFSAMSEIRELILDLPAVNPQEPKTDILDKIRAEIEQLPSELTTDGRRMIRRVSVYRIIDQYRLEGWMI